jgi:hypothetical protein
VVDSFQLEGGRGWPRLDGVYEPVAIVVEQAGHAATRSAVLLNRAGVVSLGHWDGSQWVKEEQESAHIGK